MSKIIKPKFDKRDYMGGILDNNVKYILIHDEHLEKSFVTVSLNIGSYANPKEYDGLAHFLEHMLFMGSNKYPNENHYYTRLNELGGYSNAYTDVTETVYYFNVFDNGLSEIIDIFSRFFIDPLFDADSVSREINAVDSEHKKNINQDNWRKYQLMLNLSNKDSPTNTFITGSLNTLNKPDIRDKMIDFYKKYYTSDNISVCIASSKPIDELEKIVVNTFGSIPKTIKEFFTIPKPFYNQNIGKTFHLKSISNNYEISYLWEIPDQKNFIDSQDFTILNLYLTNYSKNSLMFHLKNLGYLSNIYAEIKYEGIFILKLKLTKFGFENINYVENCLFEYLDLFVNSDIQKYVEYYQKSCAINFNTFKKIETEDLCNMLSVNHHYFNTPNVFDSTFLIRKIKSSDEYKNLFKTYITPEKLVRFISSQKMNGILDSEYKILPEYEAYYAEILYDFKNINLKQKIFWNDLDNQYLDIKLELTPHDSLDLADIPQLIGEKQWYGGCSKFGEPNIIIWFQMNNNKYFSTPENYILSNISCSILNYLVSVIMYKPMELNYSVSFSPRPSTASININVNALNDTSKLGLLIGDLEKFLFNIGEEYKLLTDSYIDNLIVSFKETYNNSNYLNPWEYSSFFVKDKIFSTEYSIKELLNALDKISKTEIKQYLSNLLDNSSLTSLIYGNIEKNNLTNLLKKFNKMFKTNSYQLPQINQLENVSIIHPNKQEKSNSISHYYPIGKFVPREFILLNLLMNILSQQFFDDLRTKNQLGYLVKMGMANFRDYYYIIQKVQSDKSIEIIENKIKEFNNNIKKLLSESDFNKFVETLKNQLIEPDYSLDEKFARYQPEIALRSYLFNRNQILLEQLNKIKLEDLIDFSDRYIDNKNLIKIIVKGH